MAVVSLRDVTVDDWADVVALELHERQRDWIAPNHISLLQAHYGLGGEIAHLVLVPLAIYVGDTVVGFAMYNTSPARDRYVVMRLMVDRNYQGKGHGRAALLHLLALFRALPQASEVAIGYQTGNDVAASLYRSCGFVDVSSDGDEHLMWQTLNPQPEPWRSLWRPGEAPGTEPAGQAI